MSSKIKLRKFFRELRTHITAEERECAALQAALLFSQSHLFRDNKNFACYLPFNDEFNALPLIESIWYAKKQCYLPVLTDEKTLIFVRYNYGDILHRNRYGIFEPKEIAQRIAPQQLDIVIIPLLAFDLAGTRLGAGGGYYDRTFAFLCEGARDKQPCLVGLAYANQQADALPADPWDVRLDGVITEKDLIWF